MAAFVPASAVVMMATQSVRIRGRNGHWVRMAHTIRKKIVTLLRHYRDAEPNHPKRFPFAIEHGTIAIPHSPLNHLVITSPPLF